MEVVCQVPSDFPKFLKLFIVAQSLKILYYSLSNVVRKVFSVGFVF